MATKPTLPPALADLAVTTLLRALSELLDHACTRATEAADTSESHLFNLAIGTVLPLEQDFANANAMLQAALALHRLPRKGGAQ